MKIDPQASLYSDRPVWGLRDCWQCDTPIPMIDIDRSDISPSFCPECGAGNPAGDGKEYISSETEQEKAGYDE